MEVRDNVYKIDKNNYVKLIKELYHYFSETALLL